MGPASASSEAKRLYAKVLEIKRDISSLVKCLVQGWKRGRVYSDFIYATGSTGGNGRIVMLETKGDHLQNPDTDCKREVLDFLTKSFSWDQTVLAGQLQIAMTGERVGCALVLMEDVPTRLPALIAWWSDCAGFCLRNGRLWNPV